MDQLVRRRQEVRKQEHACEFDIKSFDIYHSFAWEVLHYVIEPIIGFYSRGKPCLDQGVHSVGKGIGRDKFTTQSPPFLLTTVSDPLPQP